VNGPIRDHDADVTQTPLRCVGRRSPVSSPRPAGARVPRLRGRQDRPPTVRT
jgi:hypothetical protein